MLLDDLDMNDFELDKYDKKTIFMNENSEKATQTDRFNKTSTTESESAKSVEEHQRMIEEEQQAESEYSKQTSEASEEKESQKSLLRRLFDSLFDASSEDSRGIREDAEVDLPRSRQTSHASSARGSNDPMPNKKVKHPYNQVHHHHQKLAEVFYYQLKVPL